MRDLLKYWRGDVARIELLEDGCASVEGLTHMGQALLKDMKKVGVQVITTNNAFPEMGNQSSLDDDAVHQI
jgi:cobyric acid synthase